MLNALALAGLAALALAGPAAQATDFGPLMTVVHGAWPAKTHYAVVANYQDSQEEILALAREAGEGSTLTVLDLNSRTQIEKAGRLLTLKVKPDLLVLLPHDRFVWDGSVDSTLLVHAVARQGIPTIATTPVSIRQGAVLAMGEATGMDLLEANRLIGTIEVILPQKGRFLNTTASLDRGMASIFVVGAF